VYGVIGAVACWLHEFAAAAVVAHGLTLWWLGAPRDTWRRWCAAAAGIGSSVLPLAVVSAGQSERQLGWLGRPSPAMWLQFLAVSAVGVLLARLLVRGRPEPDGHTWDPLVRLALPMLIAPAGLLMTVSLLKPWYVERYVLYAMAGQALLAGAVLDRAITHRKRLAPAARAVTVCLTAATSVAVLLPWSLLMRSPESRKDDVVAVARAVGEHARPGDAVLFMPARRREWLLSEPAALARLDDVALARSPRASGTLQGVELPADAVRWRILAEDRVIALTDPPGQPLDRRPQEAVKRRTLRAHFEVCARSGVRGARILVYARTGECGSR
jgi:mannosyltransferase